MATKLKHLKIKKVDFVDDGANPEAFIRLYKSKDGAAPTTEENIVENPKFWNRFMDAVAKAFKLEDEQKMSPKAELKVLETNSAKSRIVRYATKSGTFAMPCNPQSVQSLMMKNWIVHRQGTQ